MANPSVSAGRYTRRAVQRTMQACLDDLENQRRKVGAELAQEGDDRSALRKELRQRFDQLRWEQLGIIRASVWLALELNEDPDRHLPRLRDSG